MGNEIASEIIKKEGDILSEKLNPNEIEEIKKILTENKDFSYINEDIFNWLLEQKELKILNKENLKEGLLIEQGAIVDKNNPNELAIYFIINGDFIILDETYGMIAVHRGSGNIIGEMGYFQGYRTASVRIETSNQEIKILGIPMRVFNELLKKDPEIKTKLEKIIKERKENEKIITTAKIGEISFNLKQYDQEENLLNKSFSLLKKEVEKSPLYYQIIYHNFKHWNEVLEFIDKTIPNIIEGKDSNIQKEILLLGQLATYYHDIGYYIPADGKFTAKNHEERSKKFIEEKSLDLGLTDRQTKSIQFMIEFTKFKFGENFIEEIKKVNQAIDELEKKKLTEETEKYLEFLKENNEIDFDFATAVLMTAKTIAIADVYGHSKNYLSSIPALWQEFVLEGTPLAKPTIIEQISASVDFFNFTEQQRLQFLLNGNYGIDSYIPEELKNKRKKNFEYLKKFKDCFEKIKQGTSSKENKENFQKLIAPFLENELWKEIIEKEMGKYKILEN